MPDISLILTIAGLCAISAVIGWSAASHVLGQRQTKRDDVRGTIEVLYRHHEGASE